MFPTELELCTTQQLVDELLKRRTFLGVVVHSEQELKSENWAGERVFKVQHNSNLHSEEVGRLLDAVASYMGHQVE